MISSHLSSFQVFDKQHQKMKAAKEEIQDSIDRLEVKHDLDFYRALINRVDSLTAQLLEHSKQEEEELVPILRKMYNPQVEIVNYIEREHAQLKQELGNLSRALKGRLEMPFEQEHDQLLSGIKDVLEQIVIHFFEEENGLFPLIQGYLKSND